MHSPQECLPFSAAFDLSKSSQESHILIVTSLMNLNVKKSEHLKILINIIEPQSIVYRLEKMFVYHSVVALKYDLVSQYQNEPHVTQEIALGQTSGKRKFLTIKQVRKSLKLIHLHLNVSFLTA